MARGAFRALKQEAGVHRIQRVPKTEKGGRRHTSTATVAVLKIVEKSETNISENDLEITTMRSSGPGGQNVNKTASCVRIKHRPSGIVVVCQQERHQSQNKELAMKILRARIQELEDNQEFEKQNRIRGHQINDANRCQKIRTYNEIEDRIMDHRTGQKIRGIKKFFNGELVLRSIE